MSRRYLSINEAKNRLLNGKEVESFLGGYKHEGKDAIRWLSFHVHIEQYHANLWEKLDQGNENFLDIHTFEGVDGDDEATELFFNDSFEELLEILELRFPKLSSKLVNSGIVQDEYYNFKTSRRT